MTLGKSRALVVFLGVCLCALSPPTLLAGTGFRDVLELAELGPEVLAEFSDTSDYEAEDWRLLIQLLHRLNRYPTAQQADWALAWNEHPKPLVGDLFDVVGTVEAVEILTLPEQLAQTHDLTSLYRCRFRLAEGESGVVGTVLSARIPSGWQTGQAIAEPIRFRGILLRRPSSPFFSPRIWLGILSKECLWGSCCSLGRAWMLRCLRK